MTRLTRFLRSVLPTDLTQIIFLLGVVCLVVSVRTSWIPKQLIAGLSDISWSQVEYSHITGQLLLFAKFPIIVAALTGYFLCLWAVKRPAASVVAGVIFPAALSLGIVLYTLHQFAVPPPSLLAPRSGVSTALQWIVANRWNFPTGLYLCLFGVMLFSLFLSRLAFGLTTLPLAMIERGLGNEQEISWSVIKTAIFLLLGPLVFLHNLTASFFIALYGRSPHGLASDIAWSIGTALLSAAFVTAVPLLVLGRIAWASAKKSLGPTKLSGLLWGFLFPLGVAGLTAAVQFLVARVQWTAQPFDKYDPPRFGSFLELSHLNHPTLLLACIAAFAEELVFRGVLLALLCKRFGLHRGLLSTGLVWVASHFPSDGFYGMSTGRALLHLFNRTLTCLAMNYVLAWMALRWRSIIPAGLAHSVSNIIVFAGVNIWWGDALDLRILFWAAIAYVLWRCWPITEYDTVFENVEPAKMSMASAEPAG